MDKSRENDLTVVFGAVNRGMLKNKDKCSENWNQESHSLALDSALISYYAFERFNLWLAKASFHTGRGQGCTSAGYVIYLAFKYQKTHVR